MSSGWVKLKLKIILLCVMCHVTDLPVLVRSLVEGLQVLLANVRPVLLTQRQQPGLSILQFLIDFLCLFLG